MIILAVSLSIELWWFRLFSAVRKNDITGESYQTSGAWWWGLVGCFAIRSLRYCLLWWRLPSQCRPCRRVREHQRENQRGYTWRWPCDVSVNGKLFLRGDGKDCRIAVGGINYESALFRWRFLLSASRLADIYGHDFKRFNVQIRFILGNVDQELPDVVTSKFEPTFNNGTRVWRSK